MHLAWDALESGMAELDATPREGVLRLIVRRPAVDERDVLEAAVLDVDEGLVGDTWRGRASRSTPDGSADPRAQLTLMDARVAAVIAGDPERWPLAGDQLYVDLDLAEAALPAGSRLAIGEAVIELSSKPHTGCVKFADRFGVDALRFVSTPQGRRRRLRGANARVIRGGAVRLGDVVAQRLDGRGPVP